MRPPTWRQSSAASIAEARISSSSLTAMRRAWKVRLAGWPPLAFEAAGIAFSSSSTSSPERTSGAVSRCSTMRRAIRRAKRSSPRSWRMRAISASGSSRSRSAAVGPSEVASMRMSSGASTE